MAFGFNDRRVAADVAPMLKQHIERALATSPVEEHDLAQASGQLITMLTSDADPAALVEFSVSGSLIPSQGEMYFNCSVQVRTIRAPEAPRKLEWSPESGPLSFKKPILPAADKT